MACCAEYWWPLSNFLSRPGFSLCHSHTSCGGAFKPPPPLPPVAASLGWVFLTAQWRNGGKGAGVLEPRIDEKDFEEEACKL